MQKQIEIFTDGSCLGNPRAGGIGAVFRYKQHEKTLAKAISKPPIIKWNYALSLKH